MFEGKMTEKLLPFLIFFVIFGLYSFIYEKQQEEKSYVDGLENKKTTIDPTTPVYTAF